MGKITKTIPVKLIFAFIFQDESVYNKARLCLEQKFGKIDFESQTLAFTYTDYYEKEMGKDLKRRFLSMRTPILPSDIAEIKIVTNSIESTLAKRNMRRINIDPGYLDMAKLVLASTKDFRHRIYLAKGIYAEITLYYQDKTFKPWEWTYPDYRTQEYIDTFNKIREIYSQQIKNK